MIKKIFLIAGLLFFTQNFFASSHKLSVEMLVAQEPDIIADYVNKQGQQSVRNYLEHINERYPRVGALPGGIPLKAEKSHLLAILYAIKYSA